MLTPMMPLRSQHVFLPRKDPAMNRLPAPPTRYAGLGGLIVLLLITCLATPALAGGGSVRYSYEKVEIGGGQQWVLVPHAELDLATRGKTPNKGAAIKAFELLKSKKKKAYGSASVTISPGAWPQKGRVQITLDRTLLEFAPVVLAEVVYTLTEMGIPGVEFPGYSDGLVTRADIPFSVYTLTVPAWQALPPDDISPAQVTLSSGETLWADEFYARWNKKDKALIEDLYAFLNSPNAFTAVYVMRKLPTLKIPYTAQVIPLLASSSQLVRVEALKALEADRDDKAVLDAVSARLAQEKDPGVQKLAAEFLGKSKNASYAILEPIWIIESAPQEADSVKAIASIKSYKKDARAGETLYKQLLGKRDAVASAAIEALDELGDDGTRIKALKDEKVSTDRQLQLARDLGRSKDAKTSVAGHAFLAANAPEREAARSISQLAAASSPEARQAAEDFLTDKIDWRRAAAAQGLATRNDPASIPAISAALKKHSGDEELEQAGYAIMLSQPLSTIFEQTSARDNFTQRFAYRALGARAAQEKAGKKVFDTLQKGSSSSDPLIRGASARALGALASPESAKILEGLVKDKSADVRRDVAIAIGELESGQLIDPLVAYLDDKSPAVVAASIDSLGKRKEALAWERIKAYAESKDPLIRAAALRGLARLTSRSDEQTVQEVIGTLSGAVNDKNPEVRKRAIEQLGTFKHELAVLSIAAQLQAKEVDVRVAAIRALGTTGYPTATPLVTDALDDPNPEVRRAAVLAVGDLGDKSAKNDLKTQLAAEKDGELRDMMNDALKKL